MPRRFLDQRLKLSALRMVDALATHRSLVRASAALGVTQPALTKSLHELEEQVGTRLFDRHARGVRPTPAGRTVIDMARRILADVRRLDEELDQLAMPGGGMLSIGALPVAAAGVLPGVLQRMRADHPLLKIRLREGRTEELSALLAAGEIDLMVGRLYEPGRHDECVREELWDEPISLLARPGHPVFSGSMSVERLASLDLVLPTISQRVGQEIGQALGSLGIDARHAIRSSSYGFIREMLLGADMVSVMPSTLMLGDIQRGVLRLANLPGTLPRRPAGLVLRRGTLTGPVQAFVDTLRAYAAEFARLSPPQP